MRKNILILCCGYMFGCDNAFGYHVFKVLEKMKLPENVDLMEVGFSACMIPHVIERNDKLIVVDVFNTQDEPGTIMHMKREELPVKINIKKDPAKVHLIETLEQMQLTGYCPETVFIGIVPKDIKNESEQLTPEIESKIHEIIDLIMKEIDSGQSQ